MSLPAVAYAENRLREFRELGIVDHNAVGYRLTNMGALMTALEPLQDWADDWAAAPGS